MNLRFSKMHGIGNDFVVLDGRHSPLKLTAQTIRAMAHRRTGIGFDQLLSVEPARNPSSAFYYGIWNADGSPSGQCGNGLRCVAAWLHRAGALALGERLQLESPSGVVSILLLAANRVAVDMGEPCFSTDAILLNPLSEKNPYTLEVDGERLSVNLVSMGNPHAVLIVDALQSPALDRMGSAITRHPDFPEGINTGFVQKLDRTRLRLRVHERGAGWTLACGSGACAAMAVLRRLNEVSAHVQISLPGGNLHIDWPGPGHTLWMTGPATFVFDGQWLHTPAKVKAPTHPAHQTTPSAVP